MTNRELVVQFYENGRSVDYIVNFMFKKMNKDLKGSKQIGHIVINDHYDEYYSKEYCRNCVEKTILELCREKHNPAVI